MKTELKRILLEEPLSLLQRGLTTVRSGDDRGRTLWVCLFVFTAVIADGASTFFFLRLDVAQSLREGNPFAAYAMEILGVGGYVFGAGLGSLLILPLILLGRPITPIQRILWMGALVTCLGKLLVGSWNIYLLMTY